MAMRKSIMASLLGAINSRPRALLDALVATLLARCDGDCSTQYPRWRLLRDGAESAARYAVAEAARSSVFDCAGYRGAEKARMLGRALELTPAEIANINTMLAMDGAGLFCELSWEELGLLCRADR